MAHWVLNFVSVAALVLQLTAALLDANETLAPYSKPHGSHVMENTYVIHFHKNHTLRWHEHNTGINLSKTADFYPLDLLPGYGATLDNYTLHELIRRDSGVKLVEHNMRGHRIDQGVNYSPSTNNLRKRFPTDFVEFPGFNIQMVSAGKKIAKPPSMQGSAQRLSRGGTGVHIYILDTGMRLTHQGFQGRAVNFKDQRSTPYTPTLLDMEDIGGHGTNVAGIAGGRDVGVAEYATLVNVKVVGINNTLDYMKVAAAIMDITEEHKSYRAIGDSTRKPWRGSVINMSFKVPDQNMVLENAIKNAFNEGISLVAGAGNNNTDSYNVSPCKFEEVTCIGAIDYQYRKWDMSNYGRNIQGVEPGLDVTTLSGYSDSGIYKASGTSIAAPHVAGMMAIWIYWEALNKHRDDAKRVVTRYRFNSLTNIVTGFPQRQLNNFGTTGINHPDRGSGPYVLAPAVRIPDQPNQWPLPRYSVSPAGLSNADNSTNGNFPYISVPNPSQKPDPNGNNLSCIEGFRDYAFFSQPQVQMLLNASAVEFCKENANKSFGSGTNPYVNGLVDFTMFCNSCDPETNQTVVVNETACVAGFAKINSGCDNFLGLYLDDEINYLIWTA